SVSFVLFSLCTPRPPSSTLFPYTTLFRSIHPPKNQKRCFSSYQFLRNRSKLRDYFQKLTLKWIGKLCIRYLVFFCFLADFFEWNRVVQPFSHFLRRQFQFLQILNLNPVLKLIQLFPFLPFGFHFQNQVKYAAEKT